MQPNEIYQETIPFPIGRVVVVIMVGITALFLFLFIYQLTSGPIGDSPAPDWFYLVMLVIFAGVTVLTTNFTRLTISMTPDAITVTYGRFKYTIPWYKIAGCYLDKNPGIAYGGWGIRISKAKGKSVLVYSVIGSPRVILELKEGRFRQFAFSTKHPEEVMAIVQQIG